MSRLDDARMHRPHRDLVHALPFHLHEGIVILGLFPVLHRRTVVCFLARLRERIEERGTACRRIEILAQREAAAVPRRMTQPFAMVAAFARVDAEQVIGRTLHAAGRGEDIWLMSG